MCILSCNKQPTNPNLSTGEIVYYDPANAEIARFNVMRRDGNGTFEPNIEFKKIAESSSAVVYIDNAINFDMNNVKSFFSKFNSHYYEEIYIYGEHSDLDHNGKIIFLIYKFYLQPTSGGSAGFFNSDDLFDNKKSTINKGEYLYINSDLINEPDMLAATMLHEFQHLINANVNMINGNTAMDLWLNEALSESTTILFSPFIADTNQLLLFNIIPYYSFCSWYLGGITASYSQFPSTVISLGSSSTFMRWVYHLGGKELIRDIAHSSNQLLSDKRIINSIKNRLPNLNNISSMEDLLIAWITDIYNGKLPGAKVNTYTPDASIFVKFGGLEKTDGNLPIAPGGIVLYRNDNGDPAGIKTKVLDENKKISIAINNNFLSTIYPDGTINNEYVINTKIPKVDSAASLSIKKSEFNLDLNKFCIDDVLTPEYVEEAKARAK